jgi:hypothetical protein
MEERLGPAQVVVYAFSSRELSHGDWRPVDLPPPTEEDSPLDDPSGVRARKVLARVLGVAALPGRQATPYRHVILALYLEILESGSEGERLILYSWGRKDDEPGPVAGLASGDVVEAVILPWEEMEGLYGSYQRQELADPELLFLPAYWSDEVTRR